MNKSGAKVAPVRAARSTPAKAATKSPPAKVEAPKPVSAPRTTQRTAASKQPYQSAAKAPAKPAGKAKAPRPLQKRMDFDALLAKLPGKDRANLEKHVAALGLEPDGQHLSVWRRIVSALATLAPHAAQTVGQQAVQFYVPDGKYRKQVFALEDLRDGKLSIYAPDVLSAALEAGLLRPPQGGSSEEDDHVYTVAGAGARQPLVVQQLDANNTPDPAAYYKHMLGWNRKALRITVPYDASPGQLDAVEAICSLAAQDWESTEG